MKIISFQRPALNWSNKILLITLWAHLLFSYGVINLKIPGIYYGIPMAYFALLICISDIPKQSRSSVMKSSGVLLPIGLLFLFTAFNTILNYGHYGFDSIRDVTSIVDMGFLFIGTAVIRRLGQRSINKSIDMFVRIALIYAMIYPLRESILAYLPQIKGYQGQGVPFPFAWTSMPLILACLGAYYAVLGVVFKGGMRSFAFGLTSTALMLTLHVSRSALATFIFILLMSLYMLAKKRTSKAVCLALMFVLLFAAGSILLSTGVQNYGRYAGKDYGAKGIAKLVQEIVNPAADAEFSSGYQDRLEWWDIVLRETAASPVSLIFGQGYGKELIRFELAGGVVLKDPHNDWIGLFGRGGLISLILYGMLHLKLFLISFKNARYLMNNARDHNRYLILLFYFNTACLLTSLAEPVFHFPYFGMPYYVFAGFQIHYFYLRKHQGLVIRKSIVTP